MGHLRASQLTPALAAFAVLGVLSLALPMRLPDGGSDRSIADCLTLADSPSHDLAALERCHQLVPTDVELAADLAAEYAKTRPDAAIEIYKKILELDPLYAEVRLRLARLLRDNGDDAGARSQVDAALRIQPNRRALTEFPSATKP